MTSRQQTADREGVLSEWAYEIWADWRDQHELKLVQHPQSEPGTRSWASTAYRFTLPNGWSCGHWHKSVESALRCIRVKIVRFLTHAA